LRISIQILFSPEICRDGKKIEEKEEEKGPAPLGQKTIGQMTFGQLTP
jgi:hypothetical protein